MKILLLNPPSPLLHIRGNYCSNVSKGVYYYPAMDLLVQSGILAEEFDVTVCDAVADRRSHESVLEQISRERYDGIFAVTGSASRSEDLDFFREVKKRTPGTKILLSGGYLLTDSANVFAKATWLDGALLELSSPDSVSFFRNERTSFNDIAIPGEDRAIAKIPKEKIVRYPRPRHELFPLRKYHHPNARHHPLALMFHTTGCPFRCDYCIYGITPYRVRPVNDVIDEMTFLRSRGVREVFFYDPTFAAVRNDAFQLLSAMEAQHSGIGWFCQTRVDLMTEELLRSMKKAGCHTIMFGVESADESLLKEHERKISHKKTAEIFALCRRIGIRTFSYLIIGWPGETEETIRATTELIKCLKTDFVSFNLAIPVLGTKFRTDLISEGFVAPELAEFDNSDPNPVMATQKLTKNELAAAYRRAVRSFYFRPSYILQRLASIRTWYEFKIHVREGISLFRHFGGC
jgi:anaerobic magnesium-protoporphyrin IX monomethyl ester cyclase